MASEAFDTVVQFFTMDPQFWLQPGLTWKKLQDPGDKNVLKPVPEHFIYVLAMTIGVLTFRILFERFFALPLGRYFGVHERKCFAPEPNAVLEKAFKKSWRLNKDDVVGLSKSTDQTERQVQRWFRQRRRMDIPSPMIKFQESMFRLVAYSFLLTFGCVIIPSKPFWKNTTLCYVDYPKQGIENDIFWYYMCELTFYTSLSISQFWDIKRKDFREMMAHHIATISLMAFSYLTNFTSIGSLIMFVHDWADPFLEIAKVIGYTRKPNEEHEGKSRKQAVADFTFVLFMLTFWYSRLFVYPVYFLYSSYFEMAAMLGPPMWKMYYVYNFLLFLLWGLHIYWSYQILRVLLDLILMGKVKGDIRSDDESE